MKNVEIIVILDRSGSMSSIKTDMEGGFNSFIQEQRKQSGTADARLTLVQFDSQSIDTVYESKLLNDVPPLTLEPRGSTPLLDAVGKTITQTEKRLGKTSRESNVLVLVITDGHENASHEFTKQQVKTLVQRMQDDYNWIFSYLGANVEAFAEAQSLGIPTATSSAYQPNAQSVGATYSVISEKVSSLRSGEGFTHFTPEERSKLNKGFTQTSSGVWMNEAETTGKSTPKTGSNK